MMEAGEIREQFSARAIAEIEPSIHKIIKKHLGFSEPTLITATVNAIQDGLNADQMTKRLSYHLEKRKANKLSISITDMVNDYCITRELEHNVNNGEDKEAMLNRKALASNWKRRHPNNEVDQNSALESGISPAKKLKSSNGSTDSSNITAAIPASTDSNPGVIMTPDQIKAMMSNTMQELQKRKAALAARNQATASQPPSSAASSQPSAISSSTGGDKAKTLAELQAGIQARLARVGMPPIIGAHRPAQVGSADGSQSVPKVAETRHGLILDSEGRTVDASGQELHLGRYQPTLKANLRAKKQAETEEQLAEDGTGPGGANKSSNLGAGQSLASAQVEESSQYFDSRVSLKGFVARPKRKGFVFNAPGKYVKEGNQLRMKAQLEKLQAAISTTARKTGITSATQLAKLVPKVDEKSSEIPDVEWWDALIMAPRSTYEDFISNPNSGVIKEEAITLLVEHPIQMMPMVSTDPANTHVPVYLTKKELKKLRRQNRREAWKEKQDKIRLGLETPDEPKVKMSNLMRVLGTEAVQDPTKVEAAVREQMAKRKAQHEQMNAERKLTPEQRKEKVANKLKEDTSGGVHVSVYRVKNLNSPARKFKVETNAKQLYMTGTVVLYEDVNVVVVEGGPKQQKKYKQLMLHRIKWEEDVIKEKDLQAGIAGNVEANMINSCVLVWEGQVKERCFGEIQFKQCPTEKFAREHFRKAGVEHYWDQAYSGAVLEAAEILSR